MSAAEAATADPTNLPDLADESALVLSPKEERLIGDDFMRRARREFEIIGDPLLSEYLTQLGGKLAAQSGGANQQYRFFFINDPNINAFAVPGGYIGIHSGLMLAARNEAELAAVIAHEIAHITQRHIPRMIAEAKRTSIPAMAALLAAIVLAGSSGSGQAGEAAIALTTASLAQQQLNFSRAFEQEADRIGMGILTRAGYDARAMPAFFERLLERSRLYESDLPEFLRTHPITTRRISESRDHAESYPKKSNPGNDDFYHAQAKLRTLIKASPDDVARDFKTKLAAGKYASVDAERYGYALALLGNRQFEPARQEIKSLLQKRPDYSAYRILQAEIEFADGKPESALAIYSAALKKSPSDRALERYYAEILIKVGKFDTASELLKRAVRRHPEQPELQKLYATASGSAGGKLEAHRAMAEYYYLNGNFNAALDQLHIATRHAGDSFYALSSVEARIKEIKDEMALYSKDKLDSNR